GGGHRGAGSIRDVGALSDLDIGGCRKDVGFLLELECLEPAHVLAIDIVNDPCRFLDALGGPCALSDAHSPLLPLSSSQSPSSRRRRLSSISLSIHASTSSRISFAFFEIAEADALGSL